MGNSSVLPCVVLTTVVAPWHVASTSLTSFSGAPLLLRHHYTRTLSYAFSKFTKLNNKSLCTSMYFSCSWLMINTASVVPFPELIPNCMLLAVISLRNLRSRIFSNIFITCYSSLMPPKFPHSSESPFWCVYIYIYIYIYT